MLYLKTVPRNFDGVELPDYISEALRYIDICGNTKAAIIETLFMAYKKGRDTGAENERTNPHREDMGK